MLRWVLGLPLSVLAVVAGVLVAQRLAEMPGLSVADTALPGARGELRYDAAASAAGASWPGAGPSDPLGFNAAYQPLDAEPAGLAPYPGAAEAGGQDVHHERRYRVADGGLVDEVSFWRIDRDGRPFSEQAADVLAHYAQVAAARGLSQAVAADTAPVRPRPGRQAATTALLTDPDRPGRLLTVRIAPAQTQLHVTVWLRYAEPED